MTRIHAGAWPSRLAAGVGASVAVLLSATTVHATYGVTELPNGYVLLGEDHYGTLKLSPETYLDCNGYAIYNSDQGRACQLDSGSYANCGIYINSATWLDVVNCRVEGFDVGILVSYGINAWITNTNSYGNGIGLYAEQTSFFGSSYWPSLLVSGNDFSWNREGIVLRHGRNVRIDHNWVWWSEGDGLDANYSSGNWLEWNDLRENSDHGIEIDDSYWVEAQGNYVDGYVANDGHDGLEVSDGIQMEKVDQFWINLNRIYRSGRHGVRIHDSTGGAVATNLTRQSDMVKDDVDKGYGCRSTGSDGVVYGLDNSWDSNSGCHN
jgi:hypothetical protein